MKNSSLGKCSSNDIKKKGYKITTIIHLKIIIEEKDSVFGLTLKMITSGVKAFKEIKENSNTGH